MITIKTPQEIEIMAQAGRILAGIIRELKNKVEPGITTKELDNLAEKLISNAGAKPAFKGYRGFPAALCASINEQIVHGVPSGRKLIEGDILSLDLGIIYNDFYSDMAATVPVGAIDPEVGRLIKATKKSLKRAIGRVKQGKTIGDIAQAVQSYAEGQGFQVVRELCGHGIGRRLHEDPEIPNFGKRHKGPQLKVGMVLAIEPMLTIGKPKIKLGPDGFAYQTADNSISAHFEHTVAVTEKGARVLTE